MSPEIIIIPFTDIIKASQIKGYIKSKLGISIDIVDLDREVVLLDNDDLVLEGLYEVRSNSKSGIVISVPGIDMDDEGYAFDMVEDYGLNLSNTEAQRISQQWNNLGFSIVVTLYGERDKQKLLIYQNLIYGLLSLEGGYAVVNDQSNLDIKRGVWDARHFRVHVGAGIN